MPSRGPGPHVFGDGRLGVWNVDPAKIPARAQRLRALGFTDYFLNGPKGTTAIKQGVLGAGFTGCNAWWAVDGLDASRYATRCLDDIARWSPGAGELNVELPNDPELEPYLRKAVALIRARRPAYRLRLNVAPRKAPFLPVDLLVDDPNLYCTMQVYFGNMTSRYSEADAIMGMLERGIPLAKVSVCYAGAVVVGGVTGQVRVNGLPLGWTPRRGVVFTDDLLAEAGVI